MLLHYHKHASIDFAQWDAALEKCTNALIYAQSNYLNIMCGTWDCIISEDGMYRMPIPIKTKMGITYAPTVPFVQQLGIFSTGEVTPTVQQAFVELLQKKIKLANYSFNYANPSVNGITCANYILSLQTSYANIIAGYKNDFTKDIKKVHAGISKIQNDFSIEACVDFFKAQIGQRIPHVKEKDYANLVKLCKHYKTTGQLMTKAILSAGKPVATAIFLKDDHRIYNIASAISSIGKKLKANHVLFNELIKEYANSNYVLDFEGSDIEGIANFYQQFGSTNQSYVSLHYNHLPWFLKILKK